VLSNEHLHPHYALRPLPAYRLDGLDTFFQREAGLRLRIARELDSGSEGGRGARNEDLVSVVDGAVIAYSDLKGGRGSVGGSFAVRGGVCDCGSDDLLPGLGS
jgi:hypothetical protein